MRFLPGGAGFAMALALGSVACGGSGVSPGGARDAAADQTGIGDSGSADGAAAGDGAGAGDDAPPSSGSGASGASDGAAPGSGDASPDAATLPVRFDAGPDCTADGWCWSNPWPFGDDFVGIWVTSPTDGWAVGNTGTVLHYDGARWGRLVQDAVVFTLGVWASGPGDAWVVGLSGVLLHWNGQAFEDHGLGTGKNFQAVWGSGPSDVWAVGTSGIAYHYDGSTWSSVATGTTTASFAAIGGSARDDVWIGGDDGSLRRFDGSAWHAATSPVSVPINALYGRTRADAWAATATQILHWNGSAWSIATTNASGYIHSLWASGPADVWALSDQQQLSHYDGQQWTTSKAPAAARGVDYISGSGPGDMWMAGGLGALAHWDGSQAQSVTTTATSGRVTSIAQLSGEEAYAGTESSAPVHFTGTPSWTPVAVAQGMVPPSLVWSAAPGDLWGITSGNAPTLTHWNGASWSTPVAIPSLDVPSAIWGTDATHVYVAGFTSVYLQGTTTWQTVPTNNSTMYDVWGSGPSNVWFGGDLWTFYDWNGQKWAGLGSSGNSGNDFIGVWTSGPTDTWFVGEYGNILRYDGQSLSGVQPSTEPWQDQTLRSIWGSAPGDVWVVGDQGIIGHQEGGAWKLKRSGTLHDLYRVIGTDAGHIWVGGDDGIILRRAVAN